METVAFEQSSSATPPHHRYTVTVPQGNAAVVKTGLQGPATQLFVIISCEETITPTHHAAIPYR
jgi:hypothetical protein